MVFQGDNAQPHPVRINDDYQTDQTIVSLLWPSLSIDSNLIEHFCDELGQRVYQAKKSTSWRMENES